MARVLSVRSIRELLYALGVALCAAALLLFPVQSVAAAKSGLQLCGNVIIPSLFPFFVLSSFCMEIGLVQYLGRVLEPLMRPLFRVSGACASAFVLGIILAQLAVRTGSIRASIGLHIAINCVGTVLVPMVAGLGESMEWVLVGFVLLCIVGGIVTLKFLPRVQTAPSPLPLTGGQQRKIFFLNSGMIAYMVLILALIVMVILA